MLSLSIARAEPPADLPAASGELPSFEEIFVDHAPFIWRALRRLGVAGSDAEDVCQEVFLIVHRRLSTFERRSTIKTWIYGICVRVAADYRKRAHRRHETSSDELPDGSATDNPHDQLEDRQSRALLDAALSKLDSDKRAVFVLFELEELSMVEVAEIVRCPVQTAYARLYAGRREIEGALRRVMAARRPT